MTSFDLRMDWKKNNSGKLFQSTLMMKHSKLEVLQEQLVAFDSPNIELNLTPLVSKDNNSSSEFIKNLKILKSLIICDGGWCDFSKNGFNSSQIENKQMKIVGFLGNAPLRLFFGPKLDYSSSDLIIKNITKLSDKYPNNLFLFETHCKLSSDFKWLNYIMSSVDSRNIGLVYDPINVYKHKGSLDQNFDLISNFVCHVHLKGISKDLSYRSILDSQFHYIDNLKEEALDCTFSVEIEPDNTYTLENLNNCYKFVENILN
jgi:hypothetical protein